MASLQQEPTGTFHVVIRFDGKRYKRSLNTKAESKAITRKEDIEETIDLIKRGKVVIPPGATVIDYIMSNGDPTLITSRATPAQTTPKPKALATLSNVFQQFFDSIPEGNLEPETLKMIQIHQRHLLRILKPGFDFKTLTGQHLQTYVNKRAKEKTHFIQKASGHATKGKVTRKPLSATTIRKEITTLGSVWRWATTVPIVSGPFPNRGLRFPKTDEKPPFQTWSEIERHIELGHVDCAEADALWNCLYLRKTEVADLLKYVKENANHDFVYPMIAMAAHTGARRSELLRSARSDFDFDQNVVTIQERKRVKGRRSTRRVPLTTKLKQVITEWFDIHPGGSETFANLRFLGKASQPFTRDQAQSHFRNTVKGSKWDRIKGWHCLRHSFISNLACAGIDQRIIDEFVGHTTEEMRRRYRHLFPDLKHAAINQVFG